MAGVWHFPYACSAFVLFIGPGSPCKVAGCRVGPLPWKCHPPPITRLAPPPADFVLPAVQPLLHAHSIIAQALRRFSILFRSLSP